MASKAELIEQLLELSKHEDPERVGDAVEAVKESFEALIAAERNALPPDGTEEGAPPAEPPVALESAAPRDEEEKRFKQLLDAYNQRINDIHRRRQKEEAANLAAKQGVMERMKLLIAGEENIGAAFSQLKALQEEWKAIGPVPAQAYRDLQREYSHLLDEFFYHIRIYKELRDHDLRKNTALKRALVADVKSLATRDATTPAAVRELEQMVRKYQDDWHAIGPVKREEREAVRDEFWGAVREVYDRINEHYRTVRAEHEANLEAKRNLTEKVRTLVAGLEAGATHDWKVLTEQVLELQNAWKSIGFATKKENERVWKEFREACNAFFDAKKAHFERIREQYREVRDRKAALLKEALELKDSTEWRRTAERMKELQRMWKEAGSAGPRDEHKLWNRFREACDAFFKARQEAFAKQDAEQNANAEAKEALIREIEAFSPTGDRTRDMEALKAFSLRWLNSGRVAPARFDALNELYRAALDKQYAKLRMDGEERLRMRFQDHLDGLRTAPGGRDRLERESRGMKRRIEEMEAEMRQMERNMGMFSFKSADGEAMKREMEKKIERIAREVERLKGQHRELMKELR